MKTDSVALALAAILVLLLQGAILSQEPGLMLSGSRLEQGFSIEKSSHGQVVINYSSGAMSFMDQKVMDFSATGRFVAIPRGASVDYEVVAFSTDEINDTGLNLFPVTGFESGGSYRNNPLVQTGNMFMPEEAVKLSAITRIRGVDVVKIGVIPFWYNPSAKQLIVIRDMRIRITFTGGTGEYGDDRLRNRWWDGILQRTLLNYGSLPGKNYDLPSKDDGAGYLIISPNGNEFQQWADSVKKFRTQQGILSKVVTLSEIGGNEAALIEDYIDNAYNTWNIPPVAVLLLGDYGSSAENSIISPHWQSYCVSDNIYGDVDGDDLPDIVVSRMPAQDATQLETMVTKFLNYERDPPVSAAFYNHPITSCLFNSGGWAQIVAESIAGFYEVILGKTTNRINVCNGPLPPEWSTGPGGPELAEFFGPDGLGYIPATPGEVNTTWDGTAQDVIDGINSGTFMLFRRGPGLVTGWSYPDFTNNDIEALTNQDLTFVWAANCLSGKFNASGECFAEKFLRQKYNGENAGALGVVAASEVSYSMLNDIYTMGAFDFLWPDYLPETQTNPLGIAVLPAFANAAAKFYIEQYAWPINPNNKELTYNIYHCFSDAFTTVYTQMPQELDVDHLSYVPEGVSGFDVSANEGALIALTMDGEIIGLGTGTGAPETIVIPPLVAPGQVLVTVTLQDHYRYENLIPVGDPVSMQEGVLPEFRIIPNPASGLVRVEMERGFEPSVLKMAVMDQAGRKALEFKGLRTDNGSVFLDLGNLDPGIYLFMLESKQGRGTRKLVVK